MIYLRQQKIIATAILVFTLAACTTRPTDSPINPPSPTISVTPVTQVPPPKLAPVIHYTQRYKLASFRDLPGWSADDLREVWPAFVNSCLIIHSKPEWANVCDTSKKVNGKSIRAIRNFFERYFLPYQVNNLDDTAEGMVTGYYEPLLKGARNKSEAFQTALYAAPSDLLTIDLGAVYPDLKNMRLRGRLVGNKVVPYASRADILPFLNGKELLWVDNAVDAFFLQIQGSGRVQLAETGETIRVSYADQNGHPYKSIGRYLVDAGELTLEQATAQGIKDWLAKNPARQIEVLNANPSMIFFTEEKLLNPSIGPRGSLGVPLTAERSIAIDATQLPLGAPVFLATTEPPGAKPLQRLVMAQDTGGAIRGAVRADFFWGFGHDAGELAGKMKQRGALWLLLPKSFENK